METLKQCTNSDISSSSSWSDLQLDMLKEIEKKLSYVDHIRICGVCTNWRKVGEQKGDDELLLPWLFVPHLDRENNFSYNLFEPPLASNQYRLYRDEVTIESSRPINLGDIYNHDIYYSNKICSAMYVDGWLYMVIYGNRAEITYFLLFSIATKTSFTLPQFNHPPKCYDSVFVAVSTTPDSPDCVFFALFKTNEYTRTIAIFRHGDDTQWTRIEFSITPGEPVVAGAVFIRGAFYFNLSTLAIGYYDLATHQVKLDHFSTPLEFINAAYSRPTLYGLDGELMLTYYEKVSSKFHIRKYDWLNQVWIPLNSLDGRSLYLTGHSLYVVPKNCTGGVSSASSKIYVRDKVFLKVIEYALEDGQLLECNEIFSWGFEISYTPCVMWVHPPDVLLKFGDRR